MEPTISKDNGNALDMVPTLECSHELCEFTAVKAKSAYLLYSAWHWHLHEDPNMNGDKRKRGGHDEEVPAMAVEQGLKYAEGAPTRKILQASGMQEGQDTGIFPNATITKKLDDMGLLPGGGDWKPRVN